MEQEESRFCKSCSTSFTVLYKSKKGELIESPEYCPFCGEFIDESSDDLDDEDFTDEEN
jgi:hypothetical protein